MCEAPLSLKARTVSRLRRLLSPVRRAVRSAAASPSPKGILPMRALSDSAASLAVDSTTDSSASGTIERLIADTTPSMRKDRPKTSSEVRLPAFISILGKKQGSADMGRSTAQSAHML